ncbi:alpha/beta fold hydrolase [Kribbella sp. VKM Ac-2571]|uniref:alpha/beta fold hydrolase n=1 Tax=Kribbella sp. VKM Ac-2571 TaxID=2512222 RepID=UPI00105FDB28|nr:alpha/beta hydrolase [Kribbella sp. VKM Ac-2571]
MAAALVGGVAVLIPGRSKARRAAAAVASVIAAAALLVAVIPASPDPPRPVVGSKYWELPTGSRLQYVLKPGGAGNRPPVIFLHGGPGIADLESDLSYFAPIATWGYDVYAYAQLGAGGSSRLADPRGYGRPRDVADLEAIRIRLGAARIVLIGHSYGGGIAAEYAARFPNRVAGLVLISPMPMDPHDRSPREATSILDTGQAIRLYGAVLAPRSLIGYLLLQSNPSAAHAFMGDAEADGRNDHVLELSEAALHCAGTGPHPTTSQSGFYALQYPQSIGAARVPDLQARLEVVSAPTLIVKGRCDYLSWSSALGYRRTLPNSSLVYLSDAGHNAYQDRPAEVLKAVSELLDHRPVSNRYERLEPPIDYEGPA